MEHATAAGPPMKQQQQQQAFAPDLCVVINPNNDIDTEHNASPPPANPLMHKTEQFTLLRTQQDTISKNKSTRAQSRKKRVYSMRKFILDTYSDYFHSIQKQQQQKECGNERRNIRILDVAGGKGDLSWLLLNVDGISSVVMDPRSETQHDHFLRSVRYLLEHPIEAKQRSVPGLDTFQPLASFLPQIIHRTQQRRDPIMEDYEPNSIDHILHQLQRPMHLRLCFDDYLVQTVDKIIQLNKNSKNGDALIDCNDIAQESFSIWKEYWLHATQRAVKYQRHDQRSPKTKGKKKKGQKLPNRTEQQNSNIVNSLESSSSTPVFHQPHHVHNDTTSSHHCISSVVDLTISEEQDAIEAMKTILSADLIVGFHPDQATEAIVDLAQLLQIPFAIVPCCVFPAEFPHRQVQMGDAMMTMCPVRTYQEFVLYLQQKDPRIELATLDFYASKEMAKNLVLYTTARKDCETERLD